MPEPVPARGLDADDVAVVEVGQPGRSHRSGRRRPTTLKEHSVQVRVLIPSLVVRLSLEGGGSQDQIQTMEQVTKMTRLPFTYLVGRVTREQLSPRAPVTTVADVLYKEKGVSLFEFTTCLIQPEIR